jgi:hypothetical protein
LFASFLYQLPVCNVGHIKEHKGVETTHLSAI